jgi:signal transduction histidine kinase
VDRRSNKNIVSRIKRGLDALDRQLGRLGEIGSSLALTLIAILASCAAHFVLKSAEGHYAMTMAGFCNVALETGIVAMPLIFYARNMIAQLKNSRHALEEMSRRLAITAEEAHQANRAKSAFLANMSHELRTPLNAIMGFSEVMKDEHLGPMSNPRYLSYVGDIHDSGRYLLGIINDILDLSKIEAGKMTLDNAEEFPLRDAVEGALGLIANLGGKFGVRVVSELPPADLQLMAVDRMIRQILINLVGNAIKFTPAGGSVHVSGVLEKDGGYALSVRDTGIGMNEEEIEKALTPFGQVENKATAKHTGTGLGLPLAKAMVELHDGTLTVHSMPMEGTTIVLRFPPHRISSASAAVAA